MTLPGAQMKLVGADAGHYEHEELVEEVLLAPSERVVVDVLFPDAGELTLEHRTPERTYRLASITVSRRAAGAVVRRRVREPADQPRHGRATRARRAVPRGAARQDALVRRRDGHGRARRRPVVYACPMHPEVVSDEPGSCPKCGMKLLAQAAEETTYVCPMHPEVTSDKPDRCPKCGMKLVPASLVAAGGTATSITARRATDCTSTGEAQASARPRPRARAITGHGPLSTASPSTATTPRRGSSGKTTWSRSTG